MNVWEHRFYFLLILAAIGRLSYHLDVVDTNVGVWILALGAIYCAVRWILDD